MMSSSTGLPRAVQHTIISMQRGEWKDAYPVDPAAERTRRTEQALAFLRSKGSKIA
jgi:hypothetical protein